VLGQFVDRVRVARLAPIDREPHGVAQEPVEHLGRHVRSEDTRRSAGIDRVEPDGLDVVGEYAGVRELA